MPPSDTGDVLEMTPEEIAELDAMEAGERVRDPETGAYIEEDGSFDFSDADTDPDDDDGFGLSDLTDAARDVADASSKVLDVVEDASEILDGPDDKPPARRQSGGTRTAADKTEAETTPAATAPAVVGWPSVIGFDTDGNIYFFGFQIAWWIVGIFFGIMFAIYLIYTMFFSKKKKYRF